MMTLSQAPCELNNDVPVVNPPPRVKNVANPADRAAMSADEYRASMVNAPRIISPSPIYRWKIGALDVIPKLSAFVQHCVEHPSSRSSTGDDDDDGPTADAFAFAFAKSRSMRGAK